MTSPTLRAYKSTERFSSWKKLLFRHEAGLFIALVFVFIVCSLTAPNFFTTNNLFNILRQASFTGIIAMGMTLVIVAAEIDISVGALVALTSALMGVLYRDFGRPVAEIIPVVMIVGTIIGLLAGAARAKLRVPSIIVTLALFLALRGTAEYITDAAPIALPSPFLTDVLGGRVLDIPTPALVFALMFVIMLIVTRRTVFGRQVYAIGSNPHAARLAGLPIDRIRILVFGISGFLSAVTGILLAARIGSGTSSIGNGLEFEVIAAVIIGGTRLSGGRGSIFGTLLGVLFVAVLGNALVLYGVNSYAQNIVRGLVVFIAVVISNIQSGQIRQAD